jgi:hypothetical protein
MFEPLGHKGPLGWNQRASVQLPPRRCLRRIQLPRRFDGRLFAGGSLEILQNVQL